MNHNAKITRGQPRERTIAQADAQTNATHGQVTPRKWRASHILAVAIACTTIFFALATPNACKAALLVGYETCVNQLLFALFPFLIAANLLVLCGIAPLLGRPLRPLCRLLGFGEDGAAGLLAIALLGGFAPAISALSQSVQAGQMGKVQAGKLLPLLCFLGPSYIVLAVGAGMLGNLRTGVYLFASQVLASVCSVLLLHLWDVRRGTHYNAQSQASPQPKRATKYATAHADRAPLNNQPQTQANTTDNTHPHPKTPDFTLSAVIGDCFFAFLRLCGVILYFQFLAAGICALLPAQHHWLCQMALEVTAACSTIAALGHAATFRCCAALSLLSGSILLQIAALCPKGIPCKRLLFSRLLHLPLALGFLRLFLLIPQAQAFYSSLNTRVIAMQRLPLDQALLLFLALIFLADRLRKPLQRR